MLVDLLFFLIEKLIDLFDRWFWTKERVGKYGEDLTVRKLRRLNRRGMHGTILRNVYLPKEDGTTSEIDILYVSKKGVFVLESKNYSGWIFGNAYEQNWTQSLPNHRKMSFYNPIRQNYNHIKWLKKLVGEDVQMFSVIVFSERCTLKKVTYDAENALVVKRERLVREIKRLWRKSPDVLTEQRIAEICQKLEPITNVDDAVKQAHIDSIKNAMKCPKCGVELIVRTAKKGSHAGERFYGCAAFPKCRYTRQL